MKRMMILILAVMLCTGITGCKSLSTQDMLACMEEDIQHAYSLRPMELVEGENGVLLIADVENSPDVCYAGKFENGKFVEMVPMTACGRDNYMCKWEKGYVFIADNDTAASFQAVITPSNGEPQVTRLDITATPWVYYMELPEDLSNYSGSYFFFDGDGQLIP